MFPVAQYETHENVIPGLCIVGNFYKNGLCYAMAVSKKRMAVFDSTVSPEKAKTVIKIGQRITCIEYIKIGEHDCFVVGTDCALQVYNPREQSNVFSVLNNDGVYSVYVSQSTIYSGSNCAVLGYDYNGNEVFWTVTGDIVTNINEVKINNVDYLIVASKDNMIRLFSGEESKVEIKVSSPVLFIKPTALDEFVIALENGTISLYRNLQIVWNYTCPSLIVGMQIIDFSGRMSNDVIISSMEGNIYFLSVESGSAYKTENLGTRLSSLNIVDFKGDGRSFLSAVTSDGGIRIFMPKGVEGLGKSARKAHNLKQAQPALIKEKSALLLKKYELERDIRSNFAGTQAVQQIGPPKGMQVNYALGKNLEEMCIELQIRTEPPTPIQGAIIECPTSSNTDYRVFDHNNPAEPTQKILLWLPSDVKGIMKVDAFIAGVVSSFKFAFQKFYSFFEVKNTNPTSFVEFCYTGSDLGSFISQNFVVSSDVGNTFRLCFLHVADREPIALSMKGSKCRIECEKVTTASRIIAEMCQYLQIGEFDCRAHFPGEIQNLLNTVQEFGDLEDTKVVQKAEVAGMIASLKDMIVRIENAEIIGQYNTLYESMLECERINGELAREHSKRLSNKENIVGSPKINGMIQAFAELRKGSFRSSFLQSCRKELQSRDFKKLSYILEYGHELQN